jgi:hypothetical protein
MRAPPTTLPPSFLGNGVAVVGGAIGSKPVWLFAHW